MTKQYKHIDQEIQKKVEATLNAFDSIGSIESNPFFYTRVKSKLETASEESIVFYKLKRVIVHPAFIAVILVINIFSFFYYRNHHKWQKANTLSSYEYMIKQVASDYFTNQTNLIVSDYE